MIDGQKLEVRDSGNVIRFSGGVRMVVQPDQVNDADERPMKLIRFSVFVLALSAPALAAAQAPHQGGVAPPQLGNPAQGILNDNQDQPIQIDAATLEVRDKEKMATFAGDVQVVQGDTTIKCQKLVVFYGPEPGTAADASQAKRQQQQPQQPPAQRHSRRSRWAVCRRASRTFAGSRRAAASPSSQRIKPRAAISASTI